MRRYMEIAGRLARLHGTRGGNVPARRGAARPLCNYSFCATPEIWTRKRGPAARVESSGVGVVKRRKEREEESCWRQRRKGG